MAENAPVSTPDIKSKRINHAARGTPTSPLAGLVIGFVFLAFGLGLAFVSTGVIPVKRGSIHAPVWVLGSVGAIFCTGGLLFLIDAARRKLRKNRAEQQARLFPDEPCYADYAWNSEGIADSAPSILSVIVGGLFFALFLGIFDSIAWHNKGQWILLLLLGVFHLITAGMLFYAGYLALARWKYGRSYLRFEHFPFTFGELLEASFIHDKPIRNARQLTFTLRCIQESIVESGTGKERHREVICTQIWADTFQFDQAGDLDGQQGIPVTFLLPEDRALSTTLSENPPRYWELSVHADTPGVDFKARFLVPVYARQDAKKRTDFGV